MSVPSGPNHSLELSPIGFQQKISNINKYYFDFLKVNKNLCFDMLNANERMNNVFIQCDSINVRSRGRH